MRMPLEYRTAPVDTKTAGSDDPRDRSDTAASRCDMIATRLVTTVADSAVTALTAEADPPQGILRRLRPGP